MAQKGKGADKPKRMVIYVTEEFPDWQAETLKLLERLHIEVLPAVMGFFICLCGCGCVGGIGFDYV
jgi:translation initiation factor 2B subunit (eIF-2B alpha/beta/delta family)